MEGKDFLVIANRLCGSENEAERRTAVSRAYYGSYNHIKQVLATHGIAISKTAKGHDEIYRYLNNSDIDDAVSLASTINTLRVVRNDADYDLAAQDFDKKNCILNCVKAERLIKDFETINKTDLIKNIKLYKSKIRE